MKIDWFAVVFALLIIIGVILGLNLSTKMCSILFCFNNMGSGRFNESFLFE